MSVFEINVQLDAVYLDVSRNRLHSVEMPTHSLNAQYRRGIHSLTNCSSVFNGIKSRRFHSAPGNSLAYTGKPEG